MMQLHEEYISRHRLNVPVIKHDTRSNVVLRNSNNKLSILDIRWIEVGNHPGYYLVTRLSSSSEHEEETEVFYEDYDEYILHLALVFRSDDIRVVAENERELAIWEIFVEMYNLGSIESIKWCVRNSIRSDRSISYRNQFYQHALLELKKFVDYYDSYFYRFLPLVKGHSFWLERIINE